MTRYRPTAPPPNLTPRERVLRALEEDLVAVGVRNPMLVASFLSRRCLAPLLVTLDERPR